MKLLKLFIKAYRYLFPPQKTEFEKAVEVWNLADGDRTLRLTYPLTKEGTVFDVGGYEGQWASDLFSKYQPIIHIFEPVAQFAKNITERFKENEKITVHNFGLSDKTEVSEIAVVHDQSSVFLESGTNEKINLISVSSFIKENNIHSIDLIKINIEGGEYPLLENLIASGDITKCKNIQVQFHYFVPNAEERVRILRESLEKTHTLTYTFPLVWENWKLND